MSRKQIRIVGRDGFPEADLDLECILQMFLRSSLGTARAGHGDMERPSGTTATWAPRLLCPAEWSGAALLPSPAATGHQMDVASQGAAKGRQQRWFATGTTSSWGSTWSLTGAWAHTGTSRG